MAVRAGGDAARRMLFQHPAGEADIRPTQTLKGEPKMETARCRRFGFEWRRRIDLLPDRRSEPDASCVTCSTPSAKIHSASALIRFRRRNAPPTPISILSHRYVEKLNLIVFKLNFDLIKTIGQLELKFV